MIGWFFFFPIFVFFGVWIFLLLTLTTFRVFWMTKEFLDFCLGNTEERLLYSSIFVIFLFNLYRILLCILSQALVQAIEHWLIFFCIVFLCKDKSNWNWNVLRGTLLIENSCSIRCLYVCACVQLMKHVCDFAVCHQLMLFLDKSLISDSLNTVHNVQFLFISRSVISMVIGVDIMALVKTHLYSFFFQCKQMQQILKHWLNCN